VAIDLVGPLQPRSDKGNRYILTLIDYATRYAEAAALPSVKTERVAEALLDMFCRKGVPEDILSDMGTQFTSDMMKEVSRLLSFSELTTTPYHPICNGWCEKMNGTIKMMLRRLCAERPKE
jgi:IS30 family transposase